MHGGQGWPAMPLVSCQHEAMAYGRAHLRSRWKPAGHGPRPLYLIFLCTELELEVEAIVGRAHNYVQCHANTQQL